MKIAGNANHKELGHLAHYLVELALVDYSMLAYTPSQLAAAAVFTAMRVLHLGGPSTASLSWGGLLCRFSGCSSGTLRACSNALAALQRKAPNTTLKAVHKKYSSSKYSEVAKLPPISDESNMHADADMLER
jgi:hypothetical protein